MLFDRRAGFFGHTHRENIVTENGTPVERLSERRFMLPRETSVVITAGATGQPRDRDLRARWLSWDTETRVVEFHRVEYDNQAAAAAILKAGLPENSAQRLLA